MLAIFCYSFIQLKPKLQSTLLYFRAAGNILKIISLIYEGNLEKKIC